MPKEGQSHATLNTVGVPMSNICVFKLYVQDAPRSDSVSVGSSRHIVLDAFPTHELFAMVVCVMHRTCSACRVLKRHTIIRETFGHEGAQWHATKEIHERSKHQASTRITDNQQPLPSKHAQGFSGGHCVWHRGQLPSPPVVQGKRLDTSVIHPRTVGSKVIE